VFKLATGVRVIPDAATGRAGVVNAAGTVMTLSATACLALVALLEHGQVADAERVLVERFPGEPVERLRADLDVLIGQLLENTVVVA
jgi:hypothetical protein